LDKKSSYTWKILDQVRLDQIPRVTSLDLSTLRIRLDVVGLR